MPKHHKYFFGFTPEEILSACDDTSDFVAQRNRHIAGLKLQGKKNVHIGQEMSLTSERISQILHKIEGKASYNKRAHLPKVLRQEDSVFDLRLSVRAENCFRSMGIYTIHDLLKCSAFNLIRCRNMGRRTLNKIELSLQKHGFELQEDRTISRDDQEALTRAEHDLALAHIGHVQAYNVYAQAQDVYNKARIVCVKAIAAHASTEV